MDTPQLSPLKFNNDIMALLVCAKKWKWHKAGKTRPCIMRNRPISVDGPALVSPCIWAADAAKQKNQPNSHGNSPCWNQHQTAQRWVICFFGSCAYPFFSVSSQSQFGSGLVEELCRGQTSRVGMLRLLWRLLLMVTKVKHSKAHRAAVAFSCQLLRITSVCCGLRRYILSSGSLTNDVAFSEWWPVIILTKYA